MIDILWLIPVSFLSMFIGWMVCWSRTSSKADVLDAKVTLYETQLHNYDLTVKEQKRKYDELYDSLLRVNKYNSELIKRLQDKRSSYEELADEIYEKFVSGASRRELCTLYPNIGYSTLCSWIRNKKKEMLVSPQNSKQGVLL